MRDRFIHPLRPSAGERRLVAAAVALCVCGGLLSFAIVTQMGDAGPFWRSLSHADLWFVASGVVGALGGLVMARDWFGHGGWRGHLSAICGGLGVSFGGALIGGSLALPFYGTMFGPLMFGLTLLGNPVLALLWLNTLVAVHLLFRVWRRERDTIFDPLPRVTRVKVAPRVRRHNWLTPSLDRAKR